MIDDIGTRIIRPSSLPTFGDCGRRYAGRHLRDLVQAAGFELRELPTSVGANVGSGVHAVASFSLEAKMLTGELAPEAESLDKGVEAFEAKIEQEGCLWDETTDKVSTAVKQIRRMGRAYRNTVAREIEPILVEKRFNAGVAPGWEISGQLDSLQAEPGRLRDLKTGRVQRANGAQYGAYRLLFQAWDYPVDSIVEDFVRRVKVDKEQPPPESHEIPVDAAAMDAWETIQRIQKATADFVDRLNTGRAPPEGAFAANPASPLCGEKWCAAFGTKFCRSHRGAR